ncbi:hypothetical protein [Acinetobacter seifertii]|uniref:hypothetical protein n=1 Tax=Acinetobacter seifertii TaxID=1530123 RepID=UPI003F52447A
MDKFEEALQQHKDNLTKNLAKFGEGHRLNRMHKEIDSNAADYEYYFQAGQQSQQAKVDELQKRVDAALEALKNKIEKVQKYEQDSFDHGAVIGLTSALRTVEQALKRCDQ